MRNKLTKDDLIFWGGADNISRTSTSKPLIQIFRYLQEKQHTNVTVIRVPQRIDLNVTRDVNEETKNLNRKLHKLAMKFKHTNVVSADLSRNYFTRHGLHLKNSGKEEITNRVVEAIRPTKEKSTETIPISVTWKDNPPTSTKEPQVIKSSVTSITDIQELKQLIRFSSQNAKGELQHTDSKILCGCNNEIQGKG
jgi:hypothetical protein